MSKLKKIAYKFGNVIPAFALVVGLSTVSQACVWWFYQPEIPEKLKKSR
ncbi:cyclic lactone autoinducer peptide [Lachnospiraceae bacterium HCP1S3_C3]|nr:cyclic lactone autoinducer peptide [Lachnospiraceae bacterium]